MTSRTDYDTLAADMARLGERPYPEVGVPMFVIAQDLSRPDAPRASTATSIKLADRFAELADMLIAHNADPSVAQMARLVEVLADEHLLELHGQRFTRVSEGLD